MLYYKVWYDAVFRLKNRILIAALPATETDRVVVKLQEAFPQFEARDSILSTSFDNTNPILHPATTIFNTGIIESNTEWHFYVDGFTPSIGKYVQEMDEERLAIGKALGLDLLSCLEQMEVEYDVVKETLAESVSSNPVYQDIGGQHTLETRYLTEDIPMGLIPFIELGNMLGLPTIRMQTAATIGQLLLGRSLMEDARTLEALGLKGMTVEEILEIMHMSRK
ncbi:hypothetical protein CSV61_12950 [Sporosarcina sp. P3]|uniref:NAD/NADP octopine/nopaline dehydrogenase family protein n=1 Tax=Sporosarcina sp. P3 TaxID=2048245 RepID=UPI000C167976|nr:NAD/NADP octopine/nopaline dehydrogenase family protein [Sporosarcina sp. P3]PID20673.1 hypothetical protein CSV61_12950 [Sporosarcina sp. P3]